MSRDARVARYIELWTGLAAADLAVVDDLVCEQVVFRDPFNTLSGRADFIRLLEHSRSTVTGLGFDMLGQGASVTSAHYYLHWRMTGTVKTIALDITGMSSLLFDEAGKIKSHTDHWDAAGQFYELLPLIGPALRAVKRRVGVKPCRMPPRR